jgi:hypothetical protein
MFETEIALAVVVGTWILYELYGRTAIDWLSAWSNPIRIAGGVAVLGYLYWQMKDQPDQFRESLDLAKQLLIHTPGSGGSGGGTREKRNVTGLMKKKVAAGQAWKCGACAATLDETYEVDHKLALYKGGSNDESNLVALCPHCHRKKTVEERLN